MRPFHLRPFVPAPGGLSLAGHITRTADGLRALYRLEGAVAVEIPPLSPAPARRDELWRDTCLELFFAVPGEPGYVEVNVSPSGDWAAYAFTGYRKDMAPLPGVRVQAEPPRRAAGGALELAFTLETEAPLPPLLEGAACAVLAHPDGTRSYWAVTHPGERPDFHQRSAFLLRV